MFCRAPPANTGLDKHADRDTRHASGRSGGQLCSQRQHTRRPSQRPAWSHCPHGSVVAVLWCARLYDYVPVWPYPHISTVTVPNWYFSLLLGEGPNRALAPVYVNRIAMHTYGAFALTKCVLHIASHTGGLGLGGRAGVYALWSTSIH